MEAMTRPAAAIAGRLREARRSVTAGGCGGAVPALRLRVPRTGLSLHATLASVALASVVVLGAAPTGARAEATVVAAGDIACSPDAPAFNGGFGTAGANPRCHQKYTSDLFAALRPTVVLPLGDTQYGRATLADFLTSYDRRDADGEPMSWGRAKEITRPAVGNHEYAETDPATGAYTGAAGYFDYFNVGGASSGPAGDRDKGYYSFDVEAGTRADGSAITWHLVALNSVCAARTAVTAGNGWEGGCAPGSAQEQWLRADLAAADARADCTLAYWHHPRFSATGGGDNPVVAPLWQALLDSHADVVLNGHHHNYQRMSPLDATGAAAAGRGLRQFVVGTGGHSLGTPPGLSRPVEAFDNTSFGVLRLGLHDGWYEWEFVPDGQSGNFRDAGRDDCVQPPPVIAAGPDGLIAAADARFSFSGRAAAGFECRLDAAPWRPCASPADYAGLPDGEHVFGVRAASPTGATELTASERRFTVDTTAPRVTTSLGHGGVVSGLVALDAGVIDASPLTQVRWLLDGRVIAGDDTAPWTAAWDSRDVPDGRHRLEVEAVDAAGNVGTSGRVGVIVANAPPVLTVALATAPRLRSVLSRGLALNVRCSRPCRLAARVEVDARTAQRLRVPRRIARAADFRLRERRTRMLVSVRPTARRRLGRLPRLRTRVVVVATDADGRTRVARRIVVLRR